MTPDLLGILNANGLFEATNPAWFETLGYEAGEIESQPFFNFIHRDDIPKTEEAFEYIQQGNPVLHFRNRYRHKDGGYRWLSWNCVPEGGKFYCSARDVTENVENQHALDREKEEARLREQFIAVLGHDLRNPVAALNSAFTLLEREANLSPRGQTVVEAGTRTINRMAEMVDALMDFARTRLGSGLSLKMSDGTGLADAIEATVEEIRAAHPDTRIQSKIDLETAVTCDIGRICQVCSNLLANAITHGASGAPIELIAMAYRSGFRITVRSRGGTISDNIFPHLFEPFVREETQPSQEGLGLGLFICSEIAKAHGGQIVVRSANGVTSFTFAMDRRGE